ncbi:DUF5685 family protein [Streptomyces cacaoi]|nr:DUF5685 family protein [Streptomyces cacaoi]NNG84919.1 hypothetical protein [Streptomyces cacaoi]
MFGMVRPCSHRLAGGLRAEWMAHLCGLCLALRGEHGQLARLVTNYDGLIVSVLTDAQSPRGAVRRRTAGPCPLRGMRTASVARGEGARLAASVSLVLASAKVRDHVADRDGLLRRRPVAAAARRIAAGWDRAGARTGAGLGFDTGVLVDAVERQPEVERRAGPGTPLTELTEPTETATAAAFAYTAELAGRPGNAGPLAEAGRLFGRLAHLLDAVEDRAEDAARGAWNPLTATGTGTGEARRLCDDALEGIRRALREVEFTDAALAHTLLVHELPQAVHRAFGTRPGAACSRHHGPADGGAPAGARPPATGGLPRSAPAPAPASASARASAPAVGPYSPALNTPQNPYGPQPPQGPAPGSPHGPYGTPNPPYGNPSPPYGNPAGDPYGSPAGDPYGNPYGGPNGSPAGGPYGNPYGGPQGPYGAPPQGTGTVPPGGGGHGGDPGGGSGGWGSGGWGPGGDGQGPHDPGPQGNGPHGDGSGGAPHPRPPKQPRGFFTGCAVATGLCCTGQMCCSGEYEGPWSRKKREGCCRDACDCCDCCNCDCGCCDCDCCDCGCDC